MSEFRTIDASFSTIQGTFIPTSEYPRLFDVTRDRNNLITSSVSIQPTMSLKHNRIVLDHTAYSNDIIVSSGTKVTGVGLYDPFTNPAIPIIFKRVNIDRYRTIDGTGVVFSGQFGQERTTIPVDYYIYNGNYYYFDPDGILFVIDASNGPVTLQTDPISIAPVALSIPDGSFIGEQLTIVINSTYSNTTLYTNFPSHGPVLIVMWNGSDWKRVTLY
tara:strand:+ start:1053 stop:1703 length:651 start_codon:yes stop_codon:yes gene_type:complete